MNEQKPTNAGMRLSEVMSILAELHQAGCRVWIAGGWGVEALVGRQTRSHRDLDLALDAEHEMAALRVLKALGYVVETDWRPVRVELVAPGRGWVDLHPVTFDHTGHGRQTDLAAATLTRRMRSPKACSAAPSCRAYPANSSCGSPWL